MATVINSLGKLKGWNSVTLRLFARDVVGVAKIAYGDEQSHANAYGAGKEPVGLEEGNYTATASIDLFDEEVRALQSVIPPGLRMQDIVPFPIIVSFEIPGGGTSTDVIHNCRFMNNGIEIKQGDGKIVRSFNLAVTHITNI
ncbi:MAG: hypothetical protein JJE55_06865 [Flavobacteriaceae bacterium]|nr:hypothetical protein [Flavobacteriaceae bacterium]